MPVPDYETLMRPVLEAIQSGATNVSETLPHLKRTFDLTEEEAGAMPPSGRVSLLASRAHWARTYLAAAGCLSSPKRNVHVMTERGRVLLKAGVGPIDNAVLSQFPDFAEWLKRQRTRNGQASGTSQVLGVPAVAVAAKTPEDLIEAAHGEIEALLVTQLLDAILTTTPTQFEQLIVDLLIAMGYGGGDRAMGERLGRSGDGGIDGVINEDALGLDAVYIQAKRYAPERRVGRPDLQAFVGSLTGEGATKGVFVTTSDFSKDAKDYLNRVQQRIVLINGEGLARLMIQHETGVRARRTYVLRSIDEDYFVQQ